MPKMKRLSGKEVVAILNKSGFKTISQKGSHVKLCNITSSGVRQILTIPLHSELDNGTLRAIIRQVSRFIPQEHLKSDFYV
ncbi:MAG: type II toxin-antitoxin system HicA family toxin [Spirochaetia bacterium]|jgi:predicted RNA binding protein YcfA (HicA-like mRNA interferase family)|nr:type II toxin-antitoxin system HicA family toxin [Spirochaetia bacterium]